VDAKMKRRIVNPRILLLDCPLEYKKGESQTNIEISHTTDFAAILRLEEEAILKLCQDIIKHKPDMVFTEKGCSDLAQHFLGKAGITVLRRLKKTDNDRIAKATGATIVHDPSSIRESDIGTGCGLFYVGQVGEDYFSYLVDCKNPKACTIKMRGASKDVLQEMERNLQDAMGVVRNILQSPLVVPGGGAAEMAMAKDILIESKKLSGIEQWPFREVATALEVIPRTLVENCGGSSIRLLTALRAKHAESKGPCPWGIDGIEGKLADMPTIGVLDPLEVKLQTIKTAIESACMLLRIDDIVSGMAEKKGGNLGSPDEDY